MTETTATYTATPSTRAGDLLSQIRIIIDERNTYKAKYERQGHVIVKLVELIEELQAFVDAEPQEPEGNEMPVTPIKPESAKPTPGASTRRFTDDDVRQWIEALREGWTQPRISAHFDVSPRTVRKRVKALGYDPVSGTLLCTQPPEPDPAPLPTSHDDPALDSFNYDDNVIAEWARLIDAGRTPELVGDRYGADPFLVRALVRGWREEYGQMPVKRA